MEGLHHDTILEPTKTSVEVRQDESSSESTTAIENKESSTIDFSKSPANLSLSKEEKIELYDKMVEFRKFEERSLRSYQQGHIGGFPTFIHWARSSCCWIVSMLGDDDHIITAYRDHGHALAVGMDFDECMAELYGKKPAAPKAKVDQCAFCSR